MFKIASVILIHIFMSLQLVYSFSLDGNMNFPAKWLPSLFRVKSDTKRGFDPPPLALYSIPPSAKNFIPFSQLFRRAPLAVADFQFSSSRTNRLHHRLPGALEHPRRSYPLFFSSSHGNPFRHSTLAFFPSINRNSLGDSAGVGVVIRTGISLDCWKTGAQGTCSRGWPRSRNV